MLYCGEREGWRCKRMSLIDAGSAVQVKPGDNLKQDIFLAHHPRLTTFSQSACRACISNSFRCLGALNFKTHYPNLNSNTTEKQSWADPCWVQEELRSPVLQNLDIIELASSVTAMKKGQVIRRGIDAETQQHEADTIFETAAQDDGIAEAFYFVNSLKTHTKLKDLCNGTQLHADIVQKGLLDKNVFVGCALLNMYAKCGVFEKAQAVFDELLIRNVASWNALITGYAQHGYCEDALNCYLRMHLEGFSPNAVTFACILSACGSVQASQMGQDIHVCVVKAGLLEDDVVLGNALVDMYAKCGLFTKAQEVLVELDVRDVVSYSALIIGYAHHGHAKEAFDCYKCMEHEGLEPNEVTFVGILKACGNTRARDKGQETHLRIVLAGLEKNLLVGTAMLDMYGNCGLLVEAQDVFDELLIHDVVSWNALIAGYTEHELDEKALDCLALMQAEGFSPNTITLACVLKTCGNLGASDTGQHIHGHVIKIGCLNEDLVCVGLIDMYANCGMLREAEEQFNKLPFCNVVSWGALMVGYAQLGKEKEVFNLLESMRVKGTKPDSVIVTILLNACCHEGLVRECEMYLEIFSKSYAIFPTLEHHTCLIDICSRAGHFDKALAIVRDMPFSANLAMWHTLLGACRKWENVNLGTWVFEQAIRLDQKDAEAYACMCSIV